LRRICHLDAASLIRAETFGLAPLTAPLFQGELPAGLRGSFFRSFIQAALCISSGPANLNAVALKTNSVFSQPSQPPKLPQPSPTLEVRAKSPCSCFQTSIVVCNSLIILASDFCNLNSEFCACILSFCSRIVLLTSPPLSHPGHRSYPCPGGWSRCRPPDPWSFWPWSSLFQKPGAWPCSRPEHQQ